MTTDGGGWTLHSYFGNVDTYGLGQNISTLTEFTNAGWVNDSMNTFTAYDSQVKMGLKINGVLQDNGTSATPRTDIYNFANGDTLTLYEDSAYIGLYDVWYR